MAARELVIAVAKQEHVDALAPQLRAADLAEVLAFGLDGHDALQQSFDNSEVSWSALAAGRVVAMFGVVRTPKGTGLLWFLTGEGFQLVALAFLRAARRIVRMLLLQYGELANFIDARYVAAVRYAQLVGAEVGQPVPLGSSGLLFHPYIFRRA